MKNIKWYSLNNEGYIIDKDKNVIWPLPIKGGIYVYKFTLNNKEELYVGSTMDIQNRFRQHRYRAWVYQETSQHDTLFYKCIAKYGWKYFTFGILEYINTNINKNINKINLLTKEQKYLDELCPKLNTIKLAGSNFGHKVDKNNKVNLELIKEQDKKLKKVIVIKRNASSESILKMKSHSGNNIIIKLFTKDNILIKTFDSIKKVADYVGLSTSTISRYIKKDLLWNNNFRFVLCTKVELNKKSMVFPLNNFKENETLIINNITKTNNRAYIFEVWYNNKLIYNFSSIQKASKFLNIATGTLIKYSRNNKLWNNKFRFKMVY